MDGGKLYSEGILRRSSPRGGQGSCPGVQLAEGEVISVEIVDVAKLEVRMLNDQ